MLINPLTKEWLDGYIENPKITLLIDAKGDVSSANEIATYIYSQVISSRNNPPIVVDIEDKKSIGVEDIRNLKQSLSLRANNHFGISRFVIIKNASTLTVEAQNSLLKLIEELPERTLITLVCSDVENIIDTILSRCFVLPVLPVTKNQATKYAEDKGIESSLAVRMFSLSEGRAGGYINLLEDDTKGTKNVELAKKFLASDVVSRQQIIDQIIKGDGNISTFLSSLKLVSKAGMQNAKTDKLKISWKNILKSIIKSEQQINQNTPTKLALLSLSVSI